MLFNSHHFIFGFLPVVLLLYWCGFARWRAKGAIIVLAAASLVFYWSGEKTYPWLLPVSIAINYGLGLVIWRAQGSRRSSAAALAIAINLCALLYFKYFNFLADQFVALHLIAVAPRRVELPIGISFFTFTQIAYLVDVYRGKAEERRAAPYSLFVTFFPHLIAGPIIHHGEMMPQFRWPKRDIPIDLYAGFAMFTIGLAKKVLVADTCGRAATMLFNFANNGSIGLIPSWLAALAYAAQIYFDFSGYSDMALGIARMFGIELPVNFNSPYKATSITEFWRRWHITLSRFLRDYLYIPLGGNRKGVERRYINLVVTMILGGMWHGAGWTFLVWGALHGAALAVAARWSDLRKNGRLFRTPRPVGWAITFLFVVFAWAPFRAPKLKTAISVWRGMAGLGGFAVPPMTPFLQIARVLHWPVLQIPLRITDAAAIAAALLLAFMAPNSQNLLGAFRIGLDSPGYGVFDPPSPIRLGANWPSAIALGLLAGFAGRAIAGHGEFIYFQF